MQTKDKPAAAGLLPAAGTFGGASIAKNRSLFLPVLMTSTALVSAAPNAAYAQNRIVDDGAVEAIDTPEAVDNLIVGNTGTGTLTISNGGAVSDLTGNIGSEPGAIGTVTVTGENASWTNAETLTIGFDGTGTLTISDGASVSNTRGFIGRGFDSNGTVTVTGAGSTWTSSENLFIGNQGEGRLTISDGGAVSTTNGVIGNGGTGAGTVTVTGANSTLTSSGNLAVGQDGTGTLTIADGGVVSNTIGVIGSNGSGMGTVAVTGAGSIWTNSSSLTVGNVSTGTLTIADGGTVNANNRPVVIASVNGSTGTLNIGATAGDAAVAAGTLNATSLVFGSGAGTLNFNHTETGYDFDAPISGNGTINQIAGVTNLTGDSSGFAGDTNITGGTLVVSNALGGAVVSVNGGTLSIEDGTVSNATGIVGASAGSTGAATITGAGSTWTNSGTLTVGSEGAGRLTIADGGAVVSNGTGLIGASIGGTGTGTVTVTGANSIWTNNGGLSVGNLAAAGTLVIANGGLVENTSGTIGSDSGTGTVTVTGENSTWANTSRLFVGNQGTGTLTIEDGGAVSNESGFIGDGVGSTGTVKVAGTDSSWTNTALTVGNEGAGTLTIANGGAVSSSSGFLGNESGSTGTVMVAGASSIWTNAGELRVGNAAAGTLTIADGGAVSNTRASIGGGSNSTGAVTVTGAGSVWNNSSNLIVGEFGTGMLTVSGGGGVISDGIGSIGGGNGSTGTVTVADANSTWTNLGNIVVGNFGTGTLTIADGGTVATNTGGGTVSLALDAGSTGTLNIGAAMEDEAAGAGRLGAARLVFGAGSGVLNFNHTAADYDLDAAITGDGTINQIAGVTNLTGDSSGFAGDTNITGGTLVVVNALGGDTVTLNGGALSIESGGVLNNADSFVGDVDGSTGTARVTGAGSTWTNSGTLFVGNFGAGTLTIADGGAASSATGTIGSVIRSTGTVTVTGADSTWTNSSNLTIGRFGTGTLTIESGGAVNNALGFIGAGIDGTGTVTVTGENSTWTNSGNLFVGDVGTGMLTIADGGAVGNATGFIGGAGGAGTVTVTGINSTWGNASNLTIGDVSSGTLTIADGGAVSNTTGSIGSGEDSIGTATVTGADSTWTNAGILFVGNEGSGTLTIADGGAVSNTNGLIGFGNNGTGMVTVAGAGSTWINSGNLFVGGFGAGTLSVESGGSVSSANTVIGNITDGTGTVTVTGVGSTWANSGNLTVGDSGAGTLTLADGGTLNANSGSGSVGVAVRAGSTGTFNIGAAAGDAAAAAGTLNAATLAFGDGTGNLNFNHTGTAYDFGAAITGTGTINQFAGVTNLTGVSAGFAGNTNITGGLLRVNGTLGGTVTVSSGTLGGSGALSGDVSVTNGAIAAGNSPGTLAIGGDLTLASASSLNFELGSPSGTAGVDSDLINVGGNLTLDGTLNVTDAGGFGAGLYRLVNYGGTLTDNGLEIGAAPNGFDRANLTVQTATANQVNLLVDAPLASFWDGANVTANNAVDGGSGTWSATGNNWTFADGSVNGQFDPSVLLIFTGTPGTVTVDDSAGAISISAGMQFAADGYTITGDDIALTGATAFRVGDGTSAGAAFIATIASNLTGAGSLNKTDLGTLVLTGANSYTGGTTISAGTLIGNATSLQGDIANNAALTFDQASAGTYADVISGSGTLTKAGAGALTLTGANSYTGGTIISAGTLIGDATSLQGDIANNAALIFDQASAGTYSGVISGSGTLTKADAGALTLTGANSYTGGTTISAGTLIGNTTSLQGDIANNAALTFNQGTAGTYAGVISGTGALTKTGAGTLTLTGNSSAYAGPTDVAAGILAVNGSLGGTMTVSGGTLGGSGTLSGDVSVTNGAIAAGNGVGTLNIGGNLSLASGSSLNFELGSPSGAAGVESDLINVGGDLTLDGTLNVTDAGGFGAGLYRLVNYDGTLTDNGLAIGTAPSGFDDTNLSVQTAMAGQVNLLVDAPVGPSSFFFWDGANTTANNGVDGGAGTWTAIDTNWTIADGSFNGAFDPSVLLIFAGTPGTVTVDDSAGAVAIQNGMQFAVDGYSVTGDAIGLSGATVVRVGDGTAAGAGYIATIASDLTGAGSLNKTDLGTLILTGANSYTGGTTISAGRLIGNTTSLPGDIVNNAALTFDQGTTGTFAGVISGTGTLTKAGAGALTLTGANSYTGGTTISAGTLIGNATSLQGDIVNNAALTFDQATDGRFADAISGTGSLTKAGAGALTLTAANSYGGGTFISAGTLIGNVESIRGDIGNAGTVVFDQAADGSFVGSIAGFDGTRGAMVKRGAGDIAIAGTSSLDWTIESGGLTTATNRFSGNASILSGGRLTFDQGSDGTYAGVLSGSGAFDLTGTGTVTLTGNSAGFTGTTTVGNGNRLVVGTSAGGALGGAMTIGSGGLLGGTGTIGSSGTTVTIAAGAVHAPGNSIGVQTIAGNYANHGTLRVEATPAAADRIVVAGTVDITGATLDLLLSPTDASSWNVFNGPFVIIDKQSAGAVVGSFDPVTQNLLFLDTILDYAGGDGNDVTLALERNDLAFADVGNTRNQIATGGAIEALGNANPLWRSIALTDDEDAVRANFDALSGEVHASAKTALIEDSRFLRNAVNDRIRAAFDSVGASGATVMTYGAGGPQTAAATTDRFALWGQGFGAWGHTDGDGNAARLDRSTGGLFMGADARVFDSWRFGVVAGYNNSSLDVKDRISAGSSDDYHLGLYGGTTWGDFTLRTGVAYTWHDISTSRSVSIPGVSDSLKGDYNAGTTQAFGELGYRVAHGSVAFEPFANLAYVSLDTDEVKEKGGVAALSGASSSTGTTFTTLGLRTSTRFDLNGASLTAKAMLGWRHAFGDVVPVTAMRFDGGNAFTIAGVPIGRDAATVELGLDYAISPHAGFGVSYAGQFGDGLVDQSFRASFTVKF